jgi:hypothetical protein
VMLWGVADHFVGEVIEVYPSRERAERARRAIVRDEPEWEGMIEVVAVADRRRCTARCEGLRRRHHTERL